MQLTVSGKAENYSPSKIILMQQYLEAVAFVMLTSQVRESEAKRIVRNFDMFKTLFN